MNMLSLFEYNISSFTERLTAIYYMGQKAHILLWSKSKTIEKQGINRASKAPVNTGLFHRESVNTIYNTCMHAVGYWGFDALFI